MKIEFIKVAIRNFFHVGAVLPSSRWSVRLVVKQLPLETMNIVEYGPGTGIVTAELLRKLKPRGNLWAVELNPDFVEVLKNIRDDRLHVVQGNVVEVASQIRDYVPQGVDAIISGIPFSFIRGENSEKLLQATKKGLREGGRFIVYQHSLKMLRPLKRHFKEVRVYFEPRNIPPYFVMVASN